MYKRSLHIFRRDLRADDNTALNKALSSSEEVIPCFILDPRLMEENKNEHAIYFMLESLKELEKETNLLVEKGHPAEVVDKLIRKYEIEAVFVNRDYTPYSRKRDEKIAEVCRKRNIEFRSFDDQLLTSPDLVFSGNNTPYTVFTPYYRKAKELNIPRPQKTKKGKFKEVKEGVSLKDYFPKTPSSFTGGRSQALKILKNIDSFSDYEQNKDHPGLQATTKLSPHLKFGTVSVREVHQAVKNKLGQEHPLVRQLYWRDFWTYVAYHFPHVFGEAFHTKFDQVKWSYDKDKFRLWCEGKTGFPIVDAGMRELNETGFMHNRVRMITASFLTKDLHIDWRWGEKYFGEKLVDHDPAVNNGNWQWAASTGCDAQPFFRVFNPWRQQKRFDPGCEYIRRWIPELKNLSASEIHNIERSPVEGYPAVLVNHAKEASKAKAAFRSLN